MLAEVGVNPKSVKYRTFGPQWVQAVALGQADAGLVWEGLRAQLVGQSATFGSAFQLKFLVGSQWGSKGPRTPMWCGRPTCRTRRRRTSTPACSRAR